MTADLVAFLNARLDEDQARAERMGHYDPDGEGGYYSCPATRAEPIGDLLAGEENCDCGMPAQRARVLADVQAKRAIIHLHRQGIDSSRGNLIGDGECRQCEFPHPCLTLRLLASVWADHVDYRPEWSPG